jgi:hypothetical protein
MVTLTKSNPARVSKFRAAGKVPRDLSRRPNRTGCSSLDDRKLNCYEVEVRPSSGECRC